MKKREKINDDVLQEVIAMLSLRLTNVDPGVWLPNGTVRRILHGKEDQAILFVPVW
jgi:hypothetical protein